MLHAIGCQQQGQQLQYAISFKEFVAAKEQRGQEQTQALTREWGVGESKAPCGKQSGLHPGSYQDQEGRGRSQGFASSSHCPASRWQSPECVLPCAG